MSMELYLDIDGVLADFASRALSIFTGPASDLTVADLDSPDALYEIAGGQAAFWDEVDACHDFWATLDRYPNAERLVKLAQEEAEDVWLLSTPSASPRSWGGKAEWVRHYLPGLTRRLVLAPQKHILATPGRILVDDLDRNVRRWRASGGRAILYPRPWNSAGHLEEGEAFDVVRERIQYESSAGRPV